MKGRKNGMTQFAEIRGHMILIHPIVGRTNWGKLWNQYFHMTITSVKSGEKSHARRIKMKQGS